VNLNESLKSAASVVAPKRRWLLAVGNLLMIFEIALALSLTLSAGLLLNSFVRLGRVDPGFRAEGLMGAILILPRAQYPDAASSLEFFRRVIEQLEAIPGVEAAGASNSLPMTGHGNGTYLKVEGRSSTSDSDPATLSAWHVVSANYLRAIGVPLRRGRLLDAHDTGNAPAAAVINEVAAQHFWPGQDPLGKRFSFGSSPLHQVVGIVGNTHLKQLDITPIPEVYIPVEQAPLQTNFLAIRASLPASRVAETVRRAVVAVDPQQPVYLTLPMTEVFNDSMAQQRLLVKLFGGFSVLALFLSAFGVYGVVAYSVSQRTREFGIRMALGAQSADILKLIIRRGLTLALLGIGIGLAAALALTSLLKTLLFGISATDPLTFTAIAMLLVVVAALACWLPARRATKVDPLVALRSE
jgi:putative ABC transport system permease protein